MVKVDGIYIYIYIVFIWTKDGLLMIYTRTKTFDAKGLSL